MAIPDSLFNLCSRNISEGLLISTRPFSCISKIAISLVEPNLFL